ncbi:hypothetical protein E3T55_10715 [Cryobacterium frigoriphilum]|uniref:Glycosyltransferase family 2 protein n=1 Tax=Cryobacterium frigoriphilum TaxID=1259150 RepID=A0A4R9A0X4_9MICO|nr:hypothetical protein [Cryobacterium frigoriphilum]TFD49818.1 hypothetical protein E3T55_10715 [Cryobacterium frigoriphilum]
MTPPRPLVLLTATVNPNVATRLTVQAVDERLRQYQQALPVWAEAAHAAGFALALVETSAADRDLLLSRTPAALADTVAVLHYTATPEQIRRGKGAIEMAAIGSALTELCLPGDTTVYKATGRLTLANADQLLRPLRPGEVAARMSLNRDYVDTRFVGASVDVWQRMLVAAGTLVDDDRGVYLEHAVASQLAAGLALKRLSLVRFTARPALGGVSGSTGQAYSASAQKAKDALLRPLESLLSRLAAKKQA